LVEKWLAESSSQWSYYRGYCLDLEQLATKFTAVLQVLQINCQCQVSHHIYFTGVSGMLKGSMTKAKALSLSAALLRQGPVTVLMLFVLYEKKKELV
jgi:hypothetical protein